jgi:hypothetical protein
MDHSRSERMVGISSDRPERANKDARRQVGSRTRGVMTDHPDTIEDLHRERIRLQSIRGAGGSFFETIIEVEIRELELEIAWSQHLAMAQGGAS